MSITAETGDTAPAVADDASRELSQRLVAAAVLIPVALGAVYAGGWIFAALAAIIVLLLAYEWENVTGDHGPGRQAVLNAVTGVIAVAVTSLGGFGTAVVVVAIGAIINSTVPRSDGTRSWWPAAGVVLVALPAVCLVWLRDGTSGLVIVIWLLAVLWATDSGGYFIGKTIGGPRLVPKISPGKTWAGFFGGSTAGALVGVGTAFLVQDAAAVRTVLASLFVSAIGQGGDIAVSAVKRKFGVKDMSNIIPGHGGVFDRLDSLLFAAIAVAALALASGGTVPLWR